MAESLNETLSAAQRAVRTFLAVVHADTEGQLTMQRERAKELLPRECRADVLRRLAGLERQLDDSYRDAIAAADELLVAVASINRPSQ